MCDIGKLAVTLANQVDLEAKSVLEELLGLGVSGDAGFLLLP